MFDRILGTLYMGEAKRRRAHCPLLSDTECQRRSCPASKQILRDETAMSGVDDLVSAIGQVARIAGLAFHKHVTLAADLTPQTILTNLICIRHLGSSCRGCASATTCALLCSL